jgi:hypothetical protein
MSNNTDPYWHLRPLPPTPDDEICSCADAPPILLQPHLSRNPVACLICNLEVPPERIRFSAALAQGLAHWQSFYNCFDFLWLDSAEFEAWAKSQLEDPSSPVNTRGLELVAELNQVRRTYYSWFQDTGAEDFQPTTRCPLCTAPLIQVHRRRLCEACSISVST